MIFLFKYIYIYINIRITIYLNRDNMLLIEVGVNADEHLLKYFLRFLFESFVSRKRWHKWHRDVACMCEKYNYYLSIMSNGVFMH